jgi:hypothetical protein
MRSPTKADIAKVQEWLGHANVSISAYTTDVKCVPRTARRSGLGISLENQEITMLALHLLQISLVYINTLMIQRILGESKWTQRMTPEDLPALTPLIYTHVTPYGMFRLDISKRLDIDAVGATA